MTEPIRAVLFDTNIILDVLLNRDPFAESASMLWALVEGRIVAGTVAAHGITTIYYIAAQRKGRQFAESITHDILTVFDVAEVNHDVVERALARGWSDFEDAVCSESALQHGADLIVTRDPAGFANAPLPVLEPLEALSILWPE